MMGRMGKRLRKGLLISFEGGEGGGKSTQIRLLRSWLVKQRYSVLVTRQPGGTALGIGIRRLLLHPTRTVVSSRAELLLYEADRAQHVDDTIEPAMNAGRIVLTDRFADSSTVYQGICRKLGRARVEVLNHFATAGRKPDLTFVLDIDPKIGLERIGRRKHLDRIEREKLAFHQSVRRGFLTLARQGSRYRIVDASRPRAEIADQIQRAVARALVRGRR